MPLSFFITLTNFSTTVAVTLQSKSFKWNLMWNSILKYYFYGSLIFSKKKKKKEAVLSSRNTGFSCNHYIFISDIIVYFFRPTGTWFVWLGLPTKLYYVISVILLEIWLTCFLLYKGKNIYLNFIAFSVLLKKILHKKTRDLTYFPLLCAGCEMPEYIFVLINDDICLP